MEHKCLNCGSEVILVEDPMFYDGWCGAICPKCGMMFVRPLFRGKEKLMKAVEILQNAKKEIMKDE